MFFTGNTFPFSVVHDINTSAEQINEDLQKISDWAYKWKRKFNHDLSKQAEKVIFSRNHTMVT